LTSDPQFHPLNAKSFLVDPDFKTPAASDSMTLVIFLLTYLITELSTRARDLPMMFSRTECDVWTEILRRST